MTLAPCDINKVFSDLFSVDEVSSVNSMTGDASTRKYFRVITHSKKKFVMQVAEAFEGENSFSYGREIFSLAGVRVPKIVARAPSNGWMLLEDLGDICYQGSLDASNIKEVLGPLESLFKADLKEIAKKLPSAPHWGWFFDFEKLNSEMLFFKKHFLEQYLANTSSKLDILENVCKFLGNCPRILCHRDYHTRNLMKHSGECFVIDFQDARLGPASYDWVSILWDPYSPISDDLKERGLEKFISLHSKIMNVTHSDSLREYWACCLQRMIKAVGSYASFKNIQGRGEYLKYILPALCNAKHAFVKMNELGFVDPKQSGFDEVIDSWVEEVKRRDIS